MALTLEAMGHQVIRLQEDSVGWDVVEWVAQQASCLLWVQTWDIDQPGAFRCLARLAALGIPSIAYHLDLFWGLAGRRPDWITEPFWRCTHVFTAADDPRWEKAGVKHHWLPPGIFGPDAHRGKVDETYAQFPVIFVGTHPYTHAEWQPTRTRLINGISATFRGQFRVYNGGIRGDSLADLYASAKVVVGDSCLAGQVKLFWSDRIPETLGRGGFLLHPWVEGIEDWYVDGEHLRLYEVGDLGQVCAQISHFLACPDEAREIADRGQALVLSRDLYSHRLQTVLDTVFAAGKEPQRPRVKVA